MDEYIRWLQYFAGRNRGTYSKTIGAADGFTDDWEAQFQPNAESNKWGELCFFCQCALLMCLILISRCHDYCAANNRGAYDLTNDCSSKLFAI